MAELSCMSDLEDQQLGDAVALADALSDGVVLLHLSGGIVHINPALRESLGWANDDIVGHSCFDYVHPDDFPAAAPVFWGGVSGERARPVELRLRATDGSWHPAEASVGTLPGAPFLIVLFRDLQPRHEQARAARHEHELLSTLVREMGVGIVAVDAAGDLVTFNEVMTSRHRGLQPGAPMPRWAAAIPLFDVLGSPLPEEQNPILRICRGERLRDIECATVSKDGNTIHIRVSGQPLSDGAGTPLGAFAMMHDITEQRAAERELRRQANADPLTGLLNRAALFDYLSATILTTEAEAPLTVLFMDLDGFKPVNDDLGHRVGDLLLAAVGERISAAVPGSAVARPGGDEFVVVMHTDAAVEIASRVREAVERPILIEGRLSTPRVSIGVAVHAAPGTTPAQLIHMADSAMYQDKMRRRALAPNRAA
jgi:diguanylate cyclase (GGDEF)-like protein/PAS domain S-box-containing protein